MSSQVFSALVTGQTGLPITVDFSFYALTPVVGFIVTIDWGQIFRHYSGDERFRAAAPYLGFFGAPDEGSAKQIREDLINNKDIKVEVIGGNNLKMEDLDKLLQPILARINAELIEAIKPPLLVEPDVAAGPSAGSWGLAGYSAVMKSADKVKTGYETWDMRFKSIVERRTIAKRIYWSGRISGGYSEASHNDYNG
jgi:hypothetical protein